MESSQTLPKLTLLPEFMQIGSGILVELRLTQKRIFR